MPCAMRYSRDDDEVLPGNCPGVTAVGVIKAHRVGARFRVRVHGAGYALLRLTIAEGPLAERHPGAMPPVPAVVSWNCTIKGAGPVVGVAVKSAIPAVTDAPRSDATPCRH